MNGQQRSSASRILSRLRAVLEVVATLLVIAASVAVLLVTVSTWRRNEQAAVSAQQSQPSQQPQQAQRPPEIPPPTKPLPLDDATVIGSRGAKVALIQYSDFECSFCAAFTRETWPAIKKQYIESGKVVAAFRHLPLPSHQYAKGAAVTAECAGQQGRFWDMHDLLFANQRDLADAKLRSIAASLKLDTTAFDECLRRQPTDRIDRDLSGAAGLGIAATPTFLIGLVQPDRTVKATHVLIGAQSLSRFAPIFDELLRM
jgi:protein-disulfide isomerase